MPDRIRIIKLFCAGGCGKLVDKYFDYEKHIYCDECWEEVARKTMIK